MRTVALVALALALLGTAALARPQAVEPRAMAMGFAQIAVADGPNAFVANPAGLPFLRPFGVDASHASANLAAITTTVQDDRPKEWGFLYSAKPNASPAGWGTGYWVSNQENADINSFGVGAGAQLCLCRDFTGGILIVDQDYDADVPGVIQQLESDHELVFDIGLMKRMMDGDTVWKVGVVGRDVTNELPGKATFDFGISALLSSGLLVAADANDATNELDSTFNFGVEYPLPQSGVVVRAGLNDHDFTAGAGYRWGDLEIAGAWADFDAGDEVVVGLTGCW